MEMAASVCQVSLLSQGGAVAVRDMGTEDQPEMVTGEESYVFLPGHALISTRGDTQGDVLVDLMIGEQGLSDAALLFEEVMRFSSGVVSVSDVVDPDEETLELPRPGDWRVKVYVKGRPWPDRVFVVFDERQWEDAKLK